MNSPAEIASTEALEKLFQTINDKKCFRFEAGAGAGKTYSLIKALKYLIDKESALLSKNNQKIACITYTNVAVDQINSRIDNNPVVFAGTIHAFCWSLIQSQQKLIREFIPTLGDKWPRRIEEAGGIKNQRVIYDLGYPKVTEKEIYLHHDDVIKIATDFLNNEKFKAILFSRFPIILIDEYQDTNKEFADSIKANIIENDNRFLIGLFGDHWQKIYGSKACGLITSDKIEFIGKEANFRSDKNIVTVLSRMRPELPQQEVDPDSEGEITVFHTESWTGVRRAENHWQGDLNSDIAHLFLEKTKTKLKAIGWSFEPDQTKILMLTNNVLAAEQGYSNIASVFSSNSDEYLKKENHYISFLIDCVEPTCANYEKKQYGEMFKVIGSETVKLKSQDDKITWNEDLKGLIELKRKGTIGEIIDYLKTTKRPRLSSKVEEAEEKLFQFPLLTDEDEREKQSSFYNKITELRGVQYSELVSLANYLDDKTPFSTKHGVKGAEFDNVLVVCGRGWNNYNWKDFLEWNLNGIPRNKEEAYERNRNLFYVACSRPKKRLALLFTQKLSAIAIRQLEQWFGSENIEDISQN